MSISSPITPELLVSGAVGIAEVCTDGNDVYWAESRPSEGGRVAIVRWRDGVVTEVTDADANVRTRVHEYGGGAWWVDAGRLMHSNDARGGELFLLDTESGQEVQITSAGHRYADGRFSPDSNWYVCVRERHDGPADSPVVNEIVAISTDGQGTEIVLVEGHDFFSSPRFGMGGQLVCVAWDNPNMPWDDTQLIVVDPEWLNGEAQPAIRKYCAEGQSESIVLPGWTADGRLLAVSDRSNWWNLVEVDLGDGSVTPVIQGEFEIATPGWVFGISRWCSVAGGIVVVSGTPHGDTIGFPNGFVEDQHSSVSSIHAMADGRVAYVGASHASESAVFVHDGQVAEQISVSRDLGLDPALFPDPELIAFDSAAVDATLPAGTMAHALFYEPVLADGNHLNNDELSGLPALLVLVHGGPTAAARRQLDLSIRYWTTRGVAVAAVDYRGSTLYGRKYRDELQGEWGVADVTDCVAAARYLADQGLVDANAMIIQGGSAGGLTVLNAVAKYDVFSGGVSRYGVTDLRALATETHKFEARYLDGLVGLWPEAEQVYIDRSPMSYPDEINVPMLVLQGADDKVVPPNQAEMIVSALREKGVSVTYELFEGEGHGFRQAETIVAVLNATEAFITALRMGATD